MEVSFCFMKTLERDADHCQEGFPAICHCVKKVRKSLNSQRSRGRGILRNPGKASPTCGFAESIRVFRKSHEISPCEIIIFYCDNVIQRIQWSVLTWHISRSDYLAQEQPCFIHRASRTACSGSPRHHARPCRFSARRPSSTLISDSRSTRKRARLAALRPRTAGTGRCTQRSASPRFVIFPAAVRPDAPCPDS